jgi:hypothetical protein
MAGMRILGEVIRVGMILTVLTVLTQVGGIVYLFYKPLGLWMDESTKKRWARIPLKVLLYTGLLSLASFWIVPRFAAGYGRVPLPRFATEAIPLKPAGFWITLMNRHYVQPDLLTVITSVAQEIGRQYPGTEIIYLDANFPFLDGFPLLPHRSHDDGRKLDICFLYTNTGNGERINQPLTWLGYGYSEDSGEGEYNQIEVCEEQGYWQYSLLNKLIILKDRPQFTFDERANSALLRSIARQPAVKKIFVEPHLKTRLGLQRIDKIKFHGCRAVRHDDHIHLQI